MSDLAYRTLLTSAWLEKRLAIRARAAFRTDGARHDDVEELKQDIRCHLVEAGARHDPARANAATHIQREIDYALMHWRRRRARGNPPAVSLQDVVGHDEDGTPVLRCETLEDPRTAGYSRSTDYRLDGDFPLDKAALERELSASLVRLLGHLESDGSKTEIAAREGVSRGTIHQRVKRLRRAMAALAPAVYANVKTRRGKKTRTFRRETGIVNNSGSLSRSAATA